MYEYLSTVKDKAISYWLSKIVPEGVSWSLGPTEKLFLAQWKTNVYIVMYVIL
jgi:hypothetical protein